MYRRCLNIIFIIFFSITTTHVAWAKTKLAPNSRHATLVMNSETGTILHQENATMQRYPASLTKMMTLYMTFDALKKGHIKLNQQLPISKRAASRPKSNLNLKAGQTISVLDAILACIIKSANDAAVVLAEGIEGSEENFAKAMTYKAHQLGMHHSFFRNASGLHNNQQRTTAHDMAKLAIALKRDFPERYSLFGQTSFSHKGVTYNSHNNVLKKFPGADGLKTGYVEASGFNLVTSAMRGNTNLVGVVMGGNTAVARDQRMMNLLDRYFTGTVITPVAQKIQLNNRLKQLVAKKKTTKRSTKIQKSPIKKLASR